MQQEITDCACKSDNFCCWQCTFLLKIMLLKIILIYACEQSSRQPAY